MFIGAIKKVIQDLIIPEFEFIKGEIRRLDEKIGSVQTEMTVNYQRLDEKIDSMGKRLDEKMDSMGKRLDEKIDSMDKRLNEKVDMGFTALRHEMVSEIKRVDASIVRLDDKIVAVDRKIDLAINIHERLAALEAKVAVGGVR
ncbi:hypothetical protein KKG61_04315 [bacterium]|nr:hypothetical protein [bacterium]